MKHTPPKGGEKQTMKTTTEQTEEMVYQLLKYSSYLQVASCRFIGTEDEALIIKLWDEKLLPWLKFENTQKNANIWVRPEPESAHPWLFIDDVPMDMAKKIANIYQCIVVETSPNNCQIRLVSNCDLSKEQRTEVQRSLVKLLGASADSGSIAGCKWGRLPGFRNKKLGKNGWTNLISVPDESLKKFDPSPYLNKLSPPLGVCVSRSVTNQTASSGDDQSRRDFGYIRGRLLYFKDMGYNLHEESSKLEAGLVVSSSRKRDPVDYARRTVQAVLRTI